MPEEYAPVPLDDDSAREQENRVAEMQILRNQVEELCIDKKQTEHHLELVKNYWSGTQDSQDSYWSGKAHDLEQGIGQLSAQIRQCQEELEHLEQHHHTPPPPGPKCLYWVKGTKFTALCSVIVIANLVTMFMEMFHHRYKRDFFLLDQVVLVFYVSELVLKALLYHQEFLCGTCSVVWWNWLDLIIVLVGILDQWVQPLFVSNSGDGGMHGTQHQSTAVQIVKMLRLARLARILKMAHSFMESDLSWAEGPRFQVFIMGTIGANSLIMSFESDFPDFWGWFYVEQVLLMIFSFELLVRLRHWGCKFFIHKKDLVWNWLDFCIVFGGIVDQWLMPGVHLIQALMGMQTHGKGSFGEIMQILRMARLLRILRLVRLVKNIPQLFTLIVGIMQAMQGMFWVLVLTVVFLYAFALLAVRLVGRGLVFGGEAPPEVVNIFPNVPQSMFVLFALMIQGDPAALEPLFEAMPMAKLAFVLFMVISSWAILSILTAVVSDNMINATNANRSEQDQIDKKTKDQDAKQFLSMIFSQADEDDSGELAEEEFASLLNDKATMKMICEETKMDRKDLEEVFSLMTTKGKTVSKDDFIDAVQIESNSVTERSVLRLEKRIIELQGACDNPVSSINQVGEDKVESMFASSFAKLFEMLERDRIDRQSLASKIESMQSRGREFSVVESSVTKVAEQLGSRDVIGSAANIEFSVDAALARIEEQNAAFSKQMVERIESCLQRAVASNAAASQNAFHEDLFAPALELAMEKIFERLDETKIGVAELQGLINDQFASGGEVQTMLDSSIAQIRNDLDVSSDQGKFLEDVSGLPSSLRKVEDHLESIAKEQLAILQERMDLKSQRDDLQTILARMETQLDAAQREPAADNLLRTLELKLHEHQRAATELLVASIEGKLDTRELMPRLELRLQEHQQSATDCLIANIEAKLNIGKMQADLSSLVAKYEERLEIEMSGEVAAMHALAAQLEQVEERRNPSSPAPSSAQPLLGNSPGQGTPDRLPGSLSAPGGQPSSLSAPAGLAGRNRTARCATGGTFE